MELRTIPNKHAAFEFISHAQGNLIEINLGPMWYFQFNFNRPFNAMLHELLENKFMSLSDTAATKIIVEIVELKHEVVRGPLAIGAVFNLSASVKVAITEEKSTQERTASYSISVPAPSGVPNANMLFRSHIQEAVNNLILKFAVATNKYVDSVLL